MAIPLHLKRTLAVLVPAVALLVGTTPTHYATAHGREKDLLSSYGKLPLGFEPCFEVSCVGDDDFLVHGRSHSLFLASTGVVLAPASAGQPTVRMKLAGARSGIRPRPEKKLPGKSNYIIGNDPKKWRTNVPNYAQVRYAQVYPGIDLVYYGNQGRLEYDFIVGPGVDTRLIKFEFSGGGKTMLDPKGDLVLASGAEEIRLHKPVVYQEANGIRRLVHGGFIIQAENRVAFAVASYDRAQPLVIDPVLSYSTSYANFPPGGPRIGYGIAVDTAGNTYLTGSTAVVTLTKTSVFALTCSVAKLNPTGTALVYSTYFGGSSRDVGYSIAVDSAGNAYVTGYTDSDDFATVNPLQATLRGPSAAFVAKLNSTGSALMYSTYLGGSNDESLESLNSTFSNYGVAVDTAGNAYVTGRTTSADFPTVNPLQPDLHGVRDAFVAKLTPTGSALIYSTYLGGSGSDLATSIAVDPAGNAYVTGTTNSADFPTVNPLRRSLRGFSTAFVAKLNPTGTALVYSTYLGGTFTDNGIAIAVDAAGNAYVTGVTASGDFPTVNPVQSKGSFTWTPFVSKLNPTGSALLYSTYLGGANDNVEGIAVDPAGNAYVAGSAVSADFPIVNPLQARRQGAFVAKLNANGSALVYSTYLGGSRGEVARGIAVDIAGSAYVIGYTSSSDFPTVDPAPSIYDGGPFVFKIVDQPAKTPLLPANFLVDTASFTGSSVAPGTIVSLFGESLAAANQAGAYANQPLPTTLMETTVLFNGIPAPLFFVSPTQINAQVPFELASGTAFVEVRRTNGSSPARPVAIVESSPGIFTVNQQGNGPGVIVHADTFRLVTETSPAKSAEYLSILCTGLGRLQTPIASGAIPLRPTETVLRPQVTIGNVSAPVSYSGVAPGYVGLYQVNAQIPPAVPKGNAVPVFITSGGVTSNTVSIAIE